MSSGDTLSARKLDHIEVCLDGASSQFDRLGEGFDRYRFIHDALPDLRPEDVDLSVEFLGHTLSAPFIVSSMTGGPEKGSTINTNVARAAETLGVAMAVGSQRIAIEDPSTAGSFEVRHVAPKVPLYGNLGAVQLNYGYGLAQAQAAVDMIGADGLFLHLNPAQEAVQDEGDTDFRGLFDKIVELVRAAPFPILIKETGCGVQGALAARLHQAGVAAIDVAGAGGTSWTRVEAKRSRSPNNAAVGEAFANWGMPTTETIRECREAAPDAKLIASGGVRSGLDAAKAIALGGDVVGLAQPVLEAALTDAGAVQDVLERFITELRLACFLTGSRTLADLRRPGVLRRA